MDKLSEALLDEIDKLSGEQCRSALQFLSGYDQGALQAAVAFVKEYYPND